MKLMSHPVYWKLVVFSLCFLWGSFRHKRCLSSKNSPLDSGEGFNAGGVFLPRSGLIIYFVKSSPTFVLNLLFFLIFPTDLLQDLPLTTCLLLHSN